MSAEESAAEAAAPAERWRPWQPFTFRGVARFAGGAWWRLALMELVVGVLCGVTVVWFLQKDYAPVILEAAQKMPDGATITNGMLAGVSETYLSQTRLIAIAVTPDESTDIGQSADAQIQFRQKNFRVGAVFAPDWGWQFDYGPKTVDVSGAALEPRWGAWHPVIFAGCGVGMTLAMWVNWAALALVYLAPVKIGAWFADRRVSLAGAWKFASAALMPGAFLMMFAIVLYGLELIDLIGLACFFAGHFVVGWVYMFGATPFLEHARPAEAKNPFKTE